jgi:hypothetical protein
MLRGVSVWALSARRRLPATEKTLNSGQLSAGTRKIFLSPVTRRSRIMGNLNSKEGGMKKQWQPDPMLNYRVGKMDIHLKVFQDEDGRWVQVGQPNPCCTLGLVKTSFTWEENIIEIIDGVEVEDNIPTEADGMIDVISDPTETTVEHTIFMCPICKKEFTEDMVRFDGGMFHDYAAYNKAESVADLTAPHGWDENGEPRAVPEDADERVHVGDNVVVEAAFDSKNPEFDRIPYEPGTRLSDECVKALYDLAFWIRIGKGEEFLTKNSKLFLEHGINWLAKWRELAYIVKNDEDFANIRLAIMAAKGMKMYPGSMIKLNRWLKKIQKTEVKTPNGIIHNYYEWYNMTPEQKAAAAKQKADDEARKVAEEQNAKLKELGINLQQISVVESYKMKNHFVLNINGSIIMKDKTQQSFSITWGDWASNPRFNSKIDSKFHNHALNKVFDALTSVNNKVFSDFKSLNAKVGYAIKKGV